MPPPMDAGNDEQAESDTNTILKGLNLAQHDAVTTPASVVQILAPRMNPLHVAIQMTGR